MNFLLNFALVFFAFAYGQCSILPAGLFPRTPLINETSDLPKAGKYALPDRIRLKLKNYCMHKDCKNQPESAIRQKLAVQEMFKLSDPSATPQDIEHLSTTIYEAKVKLFERHGISSFATPLDNGLWAGDIVLNQEQADFMLAVYDENMPRTKRQALYGKSFPSYKWTNPIPIVLSGLNQLQRGFTQAAIKDIEQKTCLRFYEVGENFNGYKINIQQTSGLDLCVVSQIGRQPKGSNMVSIDSSCSQYNLTSPILHELAHALGLHHTHARHDRDEFIQINWDIVDKDREMAEEFEKVDFEHFATYGLPYDFLSLMHHSALASDKHTHGGHTDGHDTDNHEGDHSHEHGDSGHSGHVDQAVFNNGKYIMVSKVEPTDHWTEHMGTNFHGLSIGDATLLSRIYCLPGCEDKTTICNLMASKGYCKADKGNFQFMFNDCKLSCGYC